MGVAIMADMFLVIAVVASAAPIAVILVASVASRREDSAGSLGSPPPGPVRAIARRILDFHSDCSRLPVRRMPATERRGIPAGAAASASLDASRFAAVRW